MEVNEVLITISIMISNFPKIVKQYLSNFPKDDYPVLNSRLFIFIWLHFALDQSESTMRSVFKRLNVRGIKVDISTFSKASKNRNSEIFKKLFNHLKAQVKKSQHLSQDELILFPLDSTIITLTSKLLWNQGIHQVKLFGGINLLTAQMVFLSILDKDMTVNMGIKR